MSIKVLVVAEPNEANRDNIARELIAIAQQLGPAGIHVIVPGEDAEARAREFAGLAEVTSLHLSHHEFDSLAFWTDFICGNAKEVRPSAILIPATLWGRDIVPRVAARLDVPIAADVVGVNVNEGGSIVCRRQVYGGRMETEIAITSPCAVISVRPGSFRGSPEPGGDADILVSVVDSIFDFRKTLLEEVAAEKPAEGIARAVRIVSGGRGLGKAENFALVEELASVLNAAVGASGAVVGAGWRPHSQQVGSTGTTVAPRLYLAVGISGAVQHTIGMSGSDAIVAINRDPEAPIFQIASLGIVGDLFEIVPALIDELKNSS